MPVQCAVAGRVEHGQPVGSGSLKFLSPCRFTRLANAFSKKVEVHAAANAIHFMWYNFVKVHQTLRMSPAMAPA